ncbi:G5 domain-containing protein [Streptococcus oricebi]
MKKLKKVKKHWVAVSVGLAASTFMVAPVSADQEGPIESDSTTRDQLIGELEALPQKAETELSNQDKASDLDQAGAFSAASEPAESGDSALEEPLAKPNLALTKESDLQPELEAEGIADQADESRQPESSDQLSDLEAQLKEKALPQLTVDNQSSKMQAAITDDNRQLVSKAQIENYDYEVKYDQKNRWYYVDALDFGLDSSDNDDDSAAINRALQAANQVLMADSAGKEYRGVAVKLSGRVNIARDPGHIDHYEIRTFGPGVAEIAKGSLGDLTDLGKISVQDYQKLNIDSDGLIKYQNSKGQTVTGLILPIYRKEGRWGQIKIDASLAHVTGLFGDGMGTTSIETERVQLGQPWDSNENDTDNRDHALLLVEEQEGFLIKDLSVHIKPPKGSLAQEEKNFYLRGMPYYGKIDGILVNDSSYVTVDGVEASGANKAGIRFGSSHNSVSHIYKWGRFRSISNLLANKAEGYSFDSLKLGRYNKVINSNSHNNRVAGVNFSYQTNFLIQSTTASENGHPRSGGTGYGFASEAGSYNKGIVFRNNLTSHNYRKGMDIHDGDQILIENNVSHGDRLLGISVYNRTFPMENVIIRKNLISQDKGNRMAFNDVDLEGRFDRGSDYIQYEAIHLQTNEKFRDLSPEGTTGYFEISANTIQGLDTSGQTLSQQAYTTNAILVRMQEPYLNYFLNIKQNTILGDSVHSIIKMINNANDNLNGSNSQTETSKFANGLGYGAGAVTISQNRIQVKSVLGSPDSYISPIYLADSTSNRLIKDKNLVAYQDKFRGSLLITENQFHFGESRMSGASNSMPLIYLTTNAEGIIMRDNLFDFGQIYRDSKQQAKPLIYATGNTGPTIQARPDGFVLNLTQQPSNLPNSLRQTQPFVFLNNQLKIAGIKQESDLKLEALRTENLVRYLYNNLFTSQDQVPVGQVQGQKLDANGNSLYQNQAQKIQAQDLRDSAQLNLQASRFSKDQPSLISSSERALSYRTDYIMDDQLLAGVVLEEKKGSQGRMRVQLQTAKIEHAPLTADGELEAYQPYPNLKKLFSLKNLKEATDNPRIPGLLRGDYVTGKGEVLTASKTYHYSGPRSTEASTQISHRYEHLPVALKTGSSYLFQNQDLLSPAQNRILRIGTRIPTASSTSETLPLDFETEYRPSQNLQVGESQELQAGKPGLKQVLYRVLKDNKSQELITKEAVSSKLLQPAQKRIVLVGTRPTTRTQERTVTEEIDFETARILDEKLEKGREIVQTPGSKGLKTLTYLDTLDANDQVLESKKISESISRPAVNQVIRVGNKEVLTTRERTVTEEIDFETARILDEKLEKGREIVQTPGSKGLKTLTYLDTLDANGQVLESKKISESISRPAVNQVIRVGNKEVLTTRERTVTEEIDFETARILDDKLEKGREIVQTPGSKGLKTLTYLDTLDANGQVLESKKISESISRPAVNQVIRVGNKEEERKVIRQVTVEIPFETLRLEDPELALGSQRLEEEGQTGIHIYIYEDSLSSQQEVISSRLLSDQISREPKNRVIRIGTRKTTSPSQKRLEISQRTEAIPFSRSLVYNPDLAPASKQVKRAGSPGQLLITEEITYLDGLESSRREISRQILIPPSPEIIELGPSQLEAEPELLKQVEPQSESLTSPKAENMGANQRTPISSPTSQLPATGQASGPNSLLLAGGLLGLASLLQVKKKEENLSEQD